VYIIVCKCFFLSRITFHYAVCQAITEPNRDGEIYVPNAQLLSMSPLGVIQHLSVKF